MPKGVNTWNKNTNVYITNGDTTTIITNKGVQILIDSDFAEKAKKYGWCITEKGVARSESHVRDSDGGGKLITLSRLVMGAKQNEQVDHKNLDRLDNRRCNLRICTNQQNCCNRRIRRDNTTGYKGVRFSKRRGCFIARIAFKGIRKEIINTDDIIEAAQAYNIAAKLLHERFALLNDAPPPDKNLERMIIERVNRLFMQAVF